MRRWLLSIFVFLAVVDIFAFPPIFASADTSSQETFQTNKTILDERVGIKATVGTVIFRVLKGELYVLLGQEALNPRKPEKAFTYADLGGTGRTGETFLNELLRELREESIGLVSPPSASFVRRSVVLKIDRHDREIVYCLYLPEPSDIVDERDLNAKLLSASDKERKENPEMYEKLHYEWIHFGDLRKVDDGGNAFVRVIDGRQGLIKIRAYFIKDFLKHPDLDKATAEIQKIGKEDDD